MDFFSSIGKPAPAVEKQVGIATRQNLREPDWGINMRICDLINSSPDEARAAVKSLRKQMQDRNPKVVLLALTVVEAAAKNCTSRVYTAELAGKLFMRDMTSLARGARGPQVMDKVLAMIQEFGLTYQNQQDVYPNFYKTYVALRNNGAVFPPAQQVPPPAAARIPTAAVDAGAIVDAGAMPGGGSAKAKAEDPQLEAEFAKLDADLREVQTRLAHASWVLGGANPSLPLGSIEEQLEFLALCPERLHVLITEGSQGALDDERLALCFNLNDDLCTLLASRQPLPQDSFSLTNNGDAGDSQKAVAGAGAGAGGEEVVDADDPFGLFAATEEASVGAATGGATSASAVDAGLVDTSDQVELSAALKSLGWRTGHDPRHNTTYFFNKRLNITQWEMPEEPVPEPVAAAAPASPLMAVAPEPVAGRSSFSLGSGTDEVDVAPESLTLAPQISAMTVPVTSATGAADTTATAAALGDAAFGDAFGDAFGSVGAGAVVSPQLAPMQPEAQGAVPTLTPPPGDATVAAPVDATATLGSLDADVDDFDSFLSMHGAEGSGADLLDASSLGVGLDGLQLNEDEDEVDLDDLFGAGLSATQ